MRVPSQLQAVGGARGPVVRRAFLSLLIGLVALAGTAGAAIGATGSGTPRVTLEGPSRVTIGEPFQVLVVARGVTNIAAYEATLRFDPTAMVFGGAERRGMGLASTGRGVEGLGPVERKDGVVIGAWSCDAPDCVTRAGTRHKEGPSGTVVLARLSFTARKSGSVDIGLGRVHLVNARGGLINTATATPTLSVSSAKTGRSVSTSTRHFSLPALRTDGSGFASAVGALKAQAKDLNRDGLVTHSDVMEAAVGWLRAREASAVCGAAAAASDVTGDKCLDVRDVQKIASGLAASTAQRPVNAARIARLAGSGNQPATIPGGGPIVVNATGDGSDAIPGDGICATSGGVCTLRAAIVEANLANGPDTITFAIPGGGVQTITLGSPLPALSDETGPTTIDGYTQPGATPNDALLADNAQLKVQVTGATNFDGMTITSASNVVTGLAMFGLHREFYLTGPGANFNQLMGNFIGENAAATINPGTFVNNAHGAQIDLGAAYNTVGGDTLASRNVVSGNAHNGIYFYDEGTDHNVIVNNIMGLSPDGTAMRRNIGRGVDINAMASFNRVGGTGPLDRNVISGNVSEGIEFSHNNMTNENRAVNNFIGTDLTGEAAPSYAANGWSGLHFEDGVTENFAIGNTVANSGCANSAGNVAMETRADGNVLKGNFIGVSANGVALAGNCLWGIVIRNGAVRNIIGPNNDIAYNPVGIRVEGGNTFGNTITRNSIHDNTTVGIDLRAPSGGGTPGNLNLASPIITQATTTVVSGTACAGCRVEIFQATGAAGVRGQGRTFLLAVNADGSGGFSVGVPNLNVGDRVTATATDSGGNTSPDALNQSVANGGGIQVIGADTYERTVSNGWGSADTGGAWTQNGGPAADYGVAAGTGTMRFTGASQSRAMLLNGVAAQDLDVTFQATFNKTASGGQEYIYAALRRQANDEYRVKLRFDTAGRVFLGASRLVGTTEQDISSSIQLAVTQGTPIMVHASLVGTNPTVIRANAWAAGNAEPSGWQMQVTDATPSLQTAGTIGLRGYVGSGTNNAPLILAFDNLSATVAGAGSPPPPPPPPPDPPDVADDAFSRVVTDSWGRADWGGTWAVATAPADYDVDGGRATMAIVPGQTRSAYLSAVSAQDVDITFRFSTNVAPSGNGSYVYAIARRIGGGTEYRFKARLSPTGSVYVQAASVVRKLETGLGPELKIPGLTYAPGTDLLVHVQFTGTSPTTVRARVWRSDAVEPSTWTYTATDSTAVLQAPGGVGLQGYTSGSASSSVLLSFDNFRATAP